MGNIIRLNGGKHYLELYENYFWERGEGWVASFNIFILEENVFSFFARFVLMGAGEKRGRAKVEMVLYSV